MTRVLIADDDGLMRAGLVELLAADPSIEVVGQAATGREALERTRLLDPDVVLMDVRMPDLDGIAATRELTHAGARARVLILTTFEQDDYIFGALRAGASGFLLKRTRPEDRIAAVHTIADGDSRLSPSVTRPRGLPNREIAAALVVEESTIRTHGKRILMKLGVRHRVQIVIFAYETGINRPAATSPSTG
jgi:DNA-binding NarL/FixJ family response regulator